MSELRLLHPNTKNNPIVVSPFLKLKESKSSRVLNRNGIKCFSTQQDNPKMKNTSRTPRLLNVAITGVTELLRLFSSFNQTTRETKKQRDEVSVSSVDDIVTILKYDYDNAYFVTGIFSSSIYAHDCTFEDPTIRFQGTELYSMNLKLLVPFFDYPSIRLKKIDKDIVSEPNFVAATWNLRTYLKLPWRPLIDIDGSTIYEINDEFRIVKHSESWSICAFEAISQIFTPSSGQSTEE